MYYGVLEGEEKKRGLVWKKGGPQDTDAGTDTDGWLEQTHIR